MILAFGPSFSLLGFSGSVQLSVDHRFFNDDRFGNQNDFSEGFIPELQLLFGVYEWESLHLELMLGVGYLQNSASTCAVLNDGTTCIDDTNFSEDRLKYRIFTILLGPQWRAWKPEFFRAIPYIQPLLTYRYGRISRQTLAVDAQRLNKGGDFGAQIEVGGYYSFFGDARRKNEMSSEWGMKDFGMNLHVRYLPAGLFKHGLGLVSNTGGWSFGSSLALDW